MNDFVWYSRLCVWVGAVILLIQSVTGRGLPAMTVLAVLLLGGGFLAFLAGLLWTSEDVQAHLAPLFEGTLPAPQAPMVQSEPAAALSHEAPAAPPVLAESAPITAPAPPTAAVSPPQTEQKPALPDRVPSYEVTDVAGEQTCVACGGALLAGQIAADCPVCGSTHHAGCWTNNRFHCAREGCTGRGSLEAPVA